MFLLGKAGREGGRGKDLGPGRVGVKGVGVGVGVGPPRPGPARGDAATRRGPRAWLGPSAFATEPPPRVPSPAGRRGGGAGSSCGAAPAPPELRPRARPSPPPRVCEPGTPPGPRPPETREKVAAPRLNFYRKRKCSLVPCLLSMSSSFQANHVVESFLLIFVRSLSQGNP